MVTVQPSGHLLPVLDFSQVTFTHVIIKRNTEVMQEQKVVVHIFLQAVQQGFFILLGKSASRRAMTSISWLYKPFS
ncbi:hypothetical protein ROSEINA2194_02206 [Roseburia inulinivorans DSM 16841]|jgi:hypothetical protein|uniref:Uncharacterized protein n=1 Tax=Roseburia inulinivorans DSM 16841 TaxID=622312 RepID=C0FTY5_9FIRM|nr:hypothetical protein ROSEINA2194_02206 [Roseburia inulinivorans DSM 16841]